MFLVYAIVLLPLLCSRLCMAPGLPWPYPAIRRQPWPNFCAFLWKVNNRQLAQKPHERHAAFLRCAKPHAEIKFELSEKPGQRKGSQVEGQGLAKTMVLSMEAMECALEQPNSEVLIKCFFWAILEWRRGMFAQA
ncbi:hypothetical protein B0H19DRAFT_1071198 [Mycena capillaripes]|nr:hypothetical protein B0H19DRAFT_1071198 [Mycena capillaripes]